MESLVDKKTTRKCVVCRVSFDLEKQPDNNLCSLCAHWLRMWEDRNQENVARINGNHYRIGKDGALIKGHGGTGFYIKFFDGRMIQTNNLWHQGSIPGKWQELGLEDNAEWSNE